MLHRLAALFGKSAMVVKEVAIDDTALDKAQVHIKARKAGFWAFLMALLRIDPTVTFDVYYSHIEYKESNMSGQLCTNYPLTAISAMVTGFTKPIFAKIIAGICFLGGLIYLLMNSSFFFGSDTSLEWLIPWGISFVVGMLCELYYATHKALMISAITHGGVQSMLIVKSSIIEGHAVNLEFANLVVAIINRNIEAQTSR